MSHLEIIRNPDFNTTEFSSIANGSGIYLMTTGRNLLDGGNEK